MHQENLSNDLTSEIFKAIAQNTFGATTQVTKVEKLNAGNDNQPYKVSLLNHSQNYVFRFCMREQDNYQHEAENYERIRRSTGISIPIIYCIDRSKKIAPTAYMVLDFLDGFEIDESVLTDVDKSDINKQIGRFTALVHQDKREAEDPASDLTIIKIRLDFIERAIEAGYIDLDIEILNKCKEVVQSEKWLISNSQSFCLNDTHLYFTKLNDGLKLSFILDPEWAHYGTVQLDLWHRMAAEKRNWDKPQNVRFLSPTEASNASFFRGYEQVASLDYERLYHTAPYYQLSIWGTVFDNLEKMPDHSRRTGIIHGEEIRVLADLISNRG